MRRPCSKAATVLVLTQKEGEILQVGDDVRIYIKRIKGNWVRLCIDAPRDVSLQRIPAPRDGERESPPERNQRTRRNLESVETDVVRINRRRNS